MMEVRKSGDRGLADHGWLRSRHSFSFADYFDEDHIEFGVLRVINEDRVAPGGGFGTHPHRDMEIISYVLEGELAHRDSMGNGSVIRPGDVQRMSAGTGVFHSEQNASRNEEVHFLQIWIRPREAGIEPGYEQKYFAPEEKRGRLRLIVSGDGAEGSVSIHQDARMLAGLFDGEERARFQAARGRRIYVHLVRGECRTSADHRRARIACSSRCGLMPRPQLHRVDALEIGAGRDAEVLVFDLPGDTARH